MNILVADGDRRFLELLRGVIEREGHEVAVFEDTARGLDRIAVRSPELLVAGLSLPDHGADDLVRAVRDHPQGRNAVIVLLATGAEDERRAVRTLVAECNVRRILRRPFPMFDLVDLIRDVDLELAGEAGDDEPSLSPLGDRGSPGNAPADLDRLSDVTLPTDSAYLHQPLSTDNLQRISRLWARRASGVLRLFDGPRGAHGWMVLGEGGPLDSQGWELLSTALHGGRLEFELRTAPGSGDHLGLGAMIFGRVRDPEQHDFLKQAAFLALLRVRADAPLTALPLTPHTRRLLEVVEPSRPLGELVSTLGLAPGDVGCDLHALDRMGLVELGTPLVARVERRRRSVSTQRLARMVEERSSPTPDSDVTSVGPPGGRGRGVLRPPEPEALSNVTQIKPGGMRKRRDEPGSDWPRLRRRLAERGRSWATRKAAQQSRSEIEQRVERLRKELDRLRHEDAAVVMGVAAAATAEQVEQAAERMRARYQGMAADPGLPREGQRMAEDILAIIEQAHQDMRRGRPTRPRPAAEDLPEEERLLEAAEQRMRRGQWGEALRLLRRARDLRLDHPGVLSSLGWATLNDPDLAPAQRIEEARGLLLLAVQFAPDDGMANLRLALFLDERGEHQAARRYAERAVRALPHDGEAAALLARLDQESGEG